MALPDIGPAVAATVLESPPLKTVRLAERVDIRWLGFPSNSQRSRKCCCDAERSVNVETLHLLVNSYGVMGAFTVARERRRFEGCLGQATELDHINPSPKAATTPTTTCAPCATSTATKRPPTTA